MPASTPIPDGSEPAPPAKPPTLTRLFAAFLGVGAQSFGGGTATQALIRRAVVEQNAWVSEAEFAHDMTLCQVAPGMNLIAMTLLTGRQVGRKGGANVALAGLVAVLGLLLPSVALTLLITAFWGRLRILPGLDAALTGGLVPAVVGVGLWSSWRTGCALATPEGEPKSAARASVRWAIAVGCGLLALCFPRLPVFALLLLGGCAGVVLARPAKRDAPSPAAEPKA